MKGFDDPARLVILLASERPAMSNGAGISLGVCITSERYGGERFLRDTVVVHPAICL
jgi:hypothetical protein